MWLTRILTSTAFLIAIVISIPLAFDVGGRACGLAFSLSLASFYFCLSLLRLLTPSSSRVRKFLSQSLSCAQWLVLPVLLIWSLNRFSVEPDSTLSWVERTFTWHRAPAAPLSQWIFGPDGLLETATVGSWDRFLRWSIPIFQLVEGFCSLLVIQAAGQITKWLVNKSNRGDTWMITLLIVSASTISSAVYFLYRIWHFPNVGNLDATLIGITMTCAVILSAWGISSGKGNPVESSLLFAYIVLCVYQMFTDYQPSSIPEPPPKDALPPIVEASYSTLLSTLPSVIHGGLTFFMAALSTITPSVLVSLAYRLFVLAASTRIIPAIREVGARALSPEASLEDLDGAGRLLGFLSWFSPSILISVYTSLLMQHFASTNVVHGEDWWRSQGGNSESNLWQWLNVAGTLAMYALELVLGKEDLDEGLAAHWKVD